MFGLIKEMIIRLLADLVNASNHTKCVSLRNKKCTTQPTIINLHPNEYTQGLHYYPFVVNSYRCHGSCNTLNDVSNKVYVPNKKEDLNLSFFNMTTGTNELKTLAKNHINVNVNLMVENVIQIKNGIMINAEASVKNIIYVKKIISGTLLHVVAKMVNI